MEGTRHLETMPWTSRKMKARGKVATQSMRRVWIGDLEEGSRKRRMAAVVMVIVGVV